MNKHHCFNVIIISLYSVVHHWFFIIESTALKSYNCYNEKNFFTFSVIIHFSLHYFIFQHKVFKPFWIVALGLGSLGEHRAALYSFQLDWSNSHREFRTERVHLVSNHDLCLMQQTGEGSLSERQTHTSKNQKQVRMITSPLIPTGTCSFIINCKTWCKWMANNLLVER